MIEIINDNKEIFEAFNGIIGIKFYKKGENNGKYEINLKKNELIECLIKDCYISINFYSQKQESLIKIASNNYTFKSKIEKVVDLVGNGLKIIFEPQNNEIQDILFKIQFKMYENKDFLLVKIIDILDRNQDQLPVHSISPLTINNSLLWLSGQITPTNLHNITWFKNGWQSWSRCKIYFGKEKDTMDSREDLFKMIFDNQDYKIKGKFYSEYCTAITAIESKNSLILGFVSLKDQFSRIILDFDNYDQIKLLTAFGCMDGVSFKDSSINSSEELFICFRTKNLGYLGLIEYAKVVNLGIREKKDKSIPIGWCSWYYYFTNISQDLMVKNLEFFKNNKNNIPIDLIQLDDGYFKEIGDYSNINSKFPNGLPWLFKKIKKNGFRGGIWTAPFFGTRNSELFKAHKDWFLKKSGKILKTHFSTEWKSFQYSLDLTNSEVIDYLSRFFSNLLYAFKNNKSKNTDFLVDYFKIDFLHAAVPFEADYNIKNLTRAQICHKGIKTIRDAITDNSFLLGCGAPLGPCIGLVDAMRISEDTAPFWEFDNNSKELKDVPRPALKEALINILYRSFMHKYFWINDPDCLMIRRRDTQLNINEIRLQMTIFGLSGGQILISDDMSKLSESEINDAKLLIPPYNPEGYDPIVVDAFISELPIIYTLETKEIIGKRYLIAIINWDEISTSKELKVSNLIPNLAKNEKNFYIYDFWNAKFLGKTKLDDVIKINKINPHSCCYLTMIPITNKLIEFPILISSNLHITQGCCEIKQFDYNVELKQLKINIELKGKREGNITVKLPKKMKVIKTNYKYRQIDSQENLWNIYVQFTNYLSFDINLE
ncbi:MAG: glycoside hydrolase family 36 protein [Promethearchaeota archaeon]